MVLWRIVQLSHRFRPPTLYRQLNLIDANEYKPNPSYLGEYRQGIIE